MRSSSRPHSGHPIRRSRLVMALAGAVLLLVTTVSPGGAQSTNGAQDEPVLTLTPSFTRVTGAESGMALTQTLVRGGFWVRVLFENDRGHVANVGTLDESLLSVTDGSVVQFVLHSAFNRIGYWRVKANDGASAVTVSVNAGVVADAYGAANAAGSVTYTAEAPLTPTLSTTAVQPVMDGSFTVTMTTNYSIPAEGCEPDEVRVFCRDDDITVSRGSVESVRWSDGGRIHTFVVSGYGPEAGFITVEIGADKFTLGDRTGTWNVASNQISVFVGPPFAVEGESSVDFPERSTTTAVGTYGVSDSEATVSWWLTGVDRSRFLINNSGELSFAEAPGNGIPTDQDRDSVYRVTVNAASSDYALFENFGTSFTATKDVAVTVSLSILDVGFASDTAWLRGTDGGFYARGDKILINVLFHDEVTVTGTPQIVLDVGESERVADYLSSHGGGRLLLFSYRVVAGDDDSDGVSVDANSLSLNGGSILDRYGHAVSLDHSAVAANSLQLVHAPPLPIAHVDIRSQPDALRGAYGKGDRIVISATARGSEEMTVTGTPQIALNVGSNERIATYTGYSDRALLFEYTVVTGDEDTDGITIDADSLSLNGGTINDLYGGAVLLRHGAVQADRIQQVSALPTGVARVFIEDPYGGDRANSSAPAPGDDDYPAYGSGDVIVVFVEFDEAVNVGAHIGAATGATIGPILTLSIGESTADAVYASTIDEGLRFRFEYTVAVGDADTDGISIDADSLSLNGATINDITGVAATLSHTAVAADPWLAVFAPGGL